MEKLTNFDLMIEKFLGFNPKDLTMSAILERCGHYQKNGEVLNGILLTTACLNTDDWSEEVATAFTTFSNVVLVKEEIQKIRWEPGSDYLVELLKQNSSAEDVFQFAMKIFVARPLGDTTATAFFLYEVLAKNNHTGLEITNKVLEFYESNDRYKDLVFASFRFLETEARQIIRKECLLSLAGKLVVSKDEEVLLSLYWYYSYLGQNDATLIIFDELLKSGITEDFFRLSHFELFHWPAFPLENIKKQYETLVLIQTGSKMNKRLTFASFLHQRKLSSLIPLCLYAKAMGNSEVEAAILWRAIKKDTVGNLIDRLEEINGYKINQRTRINFSFEKGNWVIESQNICSACFSGNDVTEKNIQRCKDLFTLNPQNSAVAQGLLGAHKYGFDTEAMEMFKYSISRKTGLANLYSLCLSILGIGSADGLRAVSKRMSQLGYKIPNNDSKKSFETVAKVYRRTMYSKKKEDIDFTLDALHFYFHFTEKEYRRIGEYQKMLSKCKEWYAPYGKRKASEEDLEQKDIKKAFHMFKNKEYRQLIKWFYDDKTLPAEIVEIVLKGSLMEGLGMAVLDAYRALVDKNYSYAAIYNIEVEPFIRFINSKSKLRFVQGSGNMVSRVWDVPVTLENPVDKTALVLSNFKN
jgi:hypothetical protein